MPCIVHAPGFYNIDNIVAYLGYPKRIHSNNNAYSFKTFLNIKKIALVILFIIYLILIVMLLQKLNIIKLR